MSDISKELFKSQTYKLIKDDNSYSIIVIGKKSIIGKLEMIIKELDVKPKPINQIAEVIPLKNSDVTSISQILKKLITSKYISKKGSPSIAPSITFDKETNSLSYLLLKNKLRY